MDDQEDWSRTSLSIWLAWIVTFIVIECVGLSPVKRWPPLTKVVRQYMPAPLVIGFLAWLFGHAVETYMEDSE